MDRFGTVLVIALAVVGLGVANGASGPDAGLLGGQSVDTNAAAGGGAGSEALPPVPAATAGDSTAPAASTQAAQPQPLTPATQPPAAAGSAASTQGDQPAPAAPAAVTPEGATPATAAPDQPAAATGADAPLLDPALLPPLTQGVRVLRQLPTKRQVVNLTFDVEGAPGPANAILDALKAAGVKASFGLTGTFITANPGVVRRMVSEGHDIFNHTFNHPSMPAIGPALRRGQLVQMENALLGLLDRKPVPVFRPPYGNFNNGVLQDVAAMGYRWVLLWDVDPQGFRGFSPKYIADTALRQAKAGSIILMHGIPQDAAALPQLLHGLKDRGLGCVTISEALGLK